MLGPKIFFGFDGSKSVYEALKRTCGALDSNYSICVMPSKRKASMLEHTEAKCGPAEASGGEPLSPSAMPSLAEPKSESNSAKDSPVKPSPPYWRILRASSSSKVSTPSSSSSVPYTPSDEPESAQKFFGRRNLRKNAGQDPDKYTPVRNMHHPAYGGDKYDGPERVGSP